MIRKEAEAHSQGQNHSQGHLLRASVALTIPRKSATEQQTLDTWTPFHRHVVEEILKCDTSSGLLEFSETMRISIII